jgi:hypothetical protein
MIRRKRDVQSMACADTSHLPLLLLLRVVVVV